ncbi:MAG TPA: class I tRNA ligase family protein [Planctomycetaceae bacterium]|jgi:isoleucyl-tRNA synthetase|nr:class I tRNA ligase family protein [Planctomycetaceae bacterium]
MFEKVTSSDFIRGEHEALRFWRGASIFAKLRAKNAGKPRWSFIDGPITANNPMGVHHAWGRTYKDVFQRYFAMAGHDQHYQNGFDCQGLWVEVEVERELKMGAKSAIEAYGIDKFVNACKQRVLQFAARQTEQSIRLGYWMDWDDPDTLRKLSAAIGTDQTVNITTPSGKAVSDRADAIVGRLGNPEWGGSYFTFSTENNETIWAFLKKCFERGKLYSGHDVMPWSGRAGSAYSQMEVADGRRLTIHRSCFVRFPLADAENEYLLVWTTTPWTLTSNVACAVNPDLDYVRLKANRDQAVYYFANDNLNFQRMEREFKEGFGRPEWGWPANAPKLKTIAQIFKEQGGFEVAGTIKGAELVGRPYRGPFDDLPAQNVSGGIPEDKALAGKTSVKSHRVIDGGRDSRGNPNVVAGEGTGIVHIAPGCGDVDYTLGKQHGLVSLAPLDEAGQFVAGFGPFEGREANDPETAQLVFDSLKAKHLLVNVEEYPHIYPFCWRTGDELVFRLVDEWFINMDWREEIKDVTRKIRWLPASIDGQEREIEWLSNMRDWLISKKRFWGLALPIWVDEKTGEFTVIGSLAELKERSVEGWDEFEGHTPHRPWIDRVKIKNPRTGNLMARVPDVGNPWLDAGIVPFSTLEYNTNRDNWRKWYPGDLVLECFPGQFRNWFYSMLSMATMMDGSPPFKTLFGHRLVMNEEGKPMHKSDGTAIWFEEAAEQLGVDTMRWMYMAQNPAADLRFGTRHPTRPVTLPTPDGPIEKTLEGSPTCEVVSKPADEIRRQVLIPLWNTYAFFVNYARLDEFDTQAASVPVAERPEIDRWILSNLQSLISVANERFREFDTASVCRQAAEFIDDLSNWYIRRNRRRFWRSRDAGDQDKLAAYQTLYHVLVELTKVLAPIIPFLTERMYANLVKSWRPDAPESVHLCDYPQSDAKLLDPDLNTRMAAAQRLVRLGHKLRDDANFRVRQPLEECRFACADVTIADSIARLSAVVEDELNVKRLTRCDNLDGLVSYTYKPNLKTLGPKYGKLLGAIGKALGAMPATTFDPLRRGESVTIPIDGTDVVLAPADVLVSTQQSTGWVSAEDRGLQIALSTELTDELVREGMARDLVRQIQQLRKDADLEIEDRIRVFHQTDDADVKQALGAHRDFLGTETQAVAIESAASAPDGVRAVSIGSAKVFLWISKVST